jgi:hypothetical protein
MLEKLIPLLGLRVDNEAIKAIYTSWNAVFPKRISCTANEPNLKGKVEKDCIRLYFGRGGNSRYLKPMPTSWEGGFFGMFYMIEFTKKSRGGIPFGVTHAMSADELTAIMGQPKIVEFMGKITTWRKNTSDKHELIVCQNDNTDGTTARSITLSYIYEPNLNTLEDYQKAGF